MAGLLLSGLTADDPEFSFFDIVTSFWVNDWIKAVIYNICTMYYISISSRFGLSVQYDSFIEELGCEL